MPAGRRSGRGPEGIGRALDAPPLGGQRPAGGGEPRPRVRQPPHVHASCSRDRFSARSPATASVSSRTFESCADGAFRRAASSRSSDCVTPRKPATCSTSDRARDSSAAQPCCSRCTSRWRDWLFPWRAAICSVRARACSISLLVSSSYRDASTCRSLERFCSTTPRSHSTTGGLLDYLHLRCGRLMSYLAPRLRFSQSRAERLPQPPL
jgi:hypothetical protein